MKDSFYDQPQHAPFTAAKRHAVSGVLAKFIDGAVARHDLPGTWGLAGPELRSGLSYEEWRRGDIPVVPYAASKRGAGTWNVVNYSYRNRVGLELLLLPVSHTGQARPSRRTSCVDTTTAGAWTTGWSRSSTDRAQLGRPTPRLR